MRNRYRRSFERRGTVVIPYGLRKETGPLSSTKGPQETLTLFGPPRLEERKGKIPEGDPRIQVIFFNKVTTIILCRE